jgi:zinc resistance-associated protein
MRGFLFAAAAAASLAGSALAYNALAESGDQSTDGPRMMAWRQDRMMHWREDRAAMTDAHIAALKAGLELNADQEKNWPAFESSLRDAAKMRAEHFAEMRKMREQMEGGQRPDPISRMQMMADHMSKAATELKAVSDAGRPLYASLDDGQKRRFGMLLRGMIGRGPHDGHHGGGEHGPAPMEQHGEMQ